MAFVMIREPGASGLERTFYAIIRENGSGAAGPYEAGADRLKDIAGAKAYIEGLL